jgi:hypothetical protein
MTGHQMIVALTAEIAEAAIVNFLERPCSSLWGRPMHDCELRLEFNVRERLQLDHLAERRQCSREDVIRAALGFVTKTE